MKNVFIFKLLKRQCILELMENGFPYSVRSNDSKEPLYHDYVFPKYLQKHNWQSDAHNLCYNRILKNISIFSNSLLIFMKNVTTKSAFFQFNSRKWFNLKYWLLLINLFSYNIFLLHYDDLRSDYGAGREKLRVGRIGTQWRGVKESLKASQFDSIYH